MAGQGQGFCVIVIDKGELYLLRCFCLFIKVNIMILGCFLLFKHPDSYFLIYNIL